MAANRDALAGKRLDSWKEIAAFFGRDERTVKRWEKERGLPVYRVPGSARGGVFAYAGELSDWLRGSGPGLGPQDSSVASPDAPLPTEAVLAQRSSSRTALLWLLPLLLVGGAIILFSSGRRPTAFRPALAASHTPDLESQDLYLKGRYFWNKRTPEDLNKAVDFFTQAIVRDPSYAQAYVGLADCYNLLREFSVMPATEAYPRALAAAQKAVELDPNSAEAHNSLGFALFWGSVDVAGAEKQFKRALELDPHDTQAHHWYATFLAETGRFPQAMEEIERARQLDPSSTAIMADKGFVLMISGRTDEAVGLLRQVEKAEPGFLSAHSYLHEIYCEKGEYNLCFQEAETTARLQQDRGAQTKVSEEEKIFAASGYGAVLEHRLQMDQKLYEQGEADDFRLAQDFSLLGHKPEALQYLEAAYEKHDLGICTIRVNPDLRALRQEPEFQQLLAKLDLPAVK